VRYTVITGASRGLGLEFVRQSLAAGDRVAATCRDPQAAGELGALARRAGDRATVVQLDVGDPISIARAAERIGAVTATVDLLVNNAGVHDLPGRREASSGRLEELEPDALLELFRVNALGPTFVTRAFRPLLATAADPAVLNITSGVGSFHEQQWGERYWGYALSKVALNMTTAKLAAALRPDRITVVAVNPGWVRTAIGGTDAELSVKESVRDILTTTDRLDPQASGSFLDRHGERLPW
jgi:NAD(P)-dependent dehydrogenase (short-subunit alcohol dehydrogenase family)